MMIEKHRIFASECVDLLVNEYGAKREGIDVSYFYYTGLGQEIGHILDGRPVLTPREMVARAIEILWPWVVGLALPTPDQQAKIDAAWAEINCEAQQHQAPEEM